MMWLAESTLSRCALNTCSCSVIPIGSPVQGTSRAGGWCFAWLAPWDKEPWWDILCEEGGVGINARSGYISLGDGLHGGEC